jgi:probable HAF family extracellular repeat protein
MMKRPVCGMLWLALVVTAAPVLAQSPSAPYRIDWLSPDFYPRAVNDQGQVVGYRGGSPGEGPALMWQDGVITDLGVGEGHDINNNGVVVLGVPVPGYGNPGAVLRFPDGTRTNLNLPQGWGGDFRHQFSINDAGQVVGQQKSATSSDGRAFLWDRGTITYLDFGVPFNTSSAHGISNAGHVVGWYSNDPFSSGGFLWKDGVTTQIGGAGVSVNDHGQVLFTTSGVWTNGDVTPIPALPLLPGSTEESGVAEGNEINNAGQVVGMSREMYLIDPESGHGMIQRAIVWDAVNGTVDLNALMGLSGDDGRQYPLAYALDINNAGQIVGFGSRGGWVLTPVPESGALLLASVAGLMLCRPNRSSYARSTGTGRPVMSLEAYARLLNRLRSVVGRKVARGSLSRAAREAGPGKKSQI